MAELALIYNTATGKSSVKKIESAQIANSAVDSDQIAANAVITSKIASGAVIASKIAAGAVNAEKLATDAVESSKILSGAVTTDKIASGAVSSSKIGAGAVSADKLAAASVTSGKLASGSVQQENLASGIAVDLAECLKVDNWTAGGPIAAYAGVAILSGSAGVLIQADAFNEARMPAIGVVIEAVASGDTVDLYHAGGCQMASGVCSGHAGEPLFVASGGLVTRTPPSASGSIQQRIGEVLDDDHMFVQPNPVVIHIAG
jgi:hypothetical protein